jgi:hypothetical protein
VEDDRDEAADEAEVEPREHASELASVGGQEAVGARLGRAEPECVHLREDPPGGELQAPARNLADAPRDRRSGELRAERTRFAGAGIGELAIGHRST